MCMLNLFFLHLWRNSPFFFAPVYKPVFYVFVSPCLLRRCASCAPPARVGIRGEDFASSALVADPFSGWVRFGSRRGVGAVQVFSAIRVHPSVRPVLAGGANPIRIMPAE